jgi:predicted ferric reductase
MKTKIFMGWLVIILLSLLPVLFWYLFRPVYDNMLSFSYITHSIGQIAALVGTTMFALTFLLSTRAKFLEDVFDGLDKVYVAHGVLGGTALILLLMHPIFLVLKFIPSNFKLAAAYLLPSAFWSVNFGIIAMLILIVLIFITLYSKMRYNTWKFSHEFLGLVFLIAVIHFFTVRNESARDYIFAGYPIYAAIVAFIGISCFIYSLIIRKLLYWNSAYTVESIRTSKDTYEILLAPTKEQLKVKAGQFVFVKFFSEGLSKEPHPFSVASKTGSKNIRIIVKSLGDYTSQLSRLKVGSKAKIEGSYGRFNNVKIAKDSIWVGGGIGITPFLGMAQDLDGKQNVDLYYSVKERNEFLCIDELKSVEKRLKGKFRLIEWVANEKGFLTYEKIAQISNGLKNKEFYLCGPAPMKIAIKEGLIKSGVKPGMIHDEEFRFR